jgi:hypothetical protein
VTNRTIKILLALNLLALALVVVCQFVTLRNVGAQTSVRTPEKDNEDLTRLMDEDQADRSPAAGRTIDWKIVGPRDEIRLRRAKELYTEDQLRTGKDYFNAALILQHSDAPDDYLLAHELCIVAIKKGAGVESLAAASEDRFLMSIGRPQRFGTQYRSDGPNAPFRLYKMDSGVTDTLRRMMNVPSLAEAKAGEAKWNRK